MYCQFLSFDKGTMLSLGEMSKGYMETLCAIFANYSKII